MSHCPTVSNTSRYFPNCRELGMDRYYTQIYFKWITYEYSTENSALCYVAAWMRGVWERMDTCISMAESLYHIPETSTILLIKCAAAAAAKSLQLCPTLCDSMIHSPPGSSVHGILQARILEWVAMPTSKGFSQPRIEPASLTSPALAGRFFTSSTTWQVLTNYTPI